MCEHGADDSTGSNSLSRASYEGEGADFQPSVRGVTCGRGPDAAVSDGSLWVPGLWGRCLRVHTGAWRLRGGGFCVGFLGFGEKFSARHGEGLHVFTERGRTAQPERSGSRACLPLTICVVFGKLFSSRAQSRFLTGLLPSLKCCSSELYSMPPSPTAHALLIGTICFLHSGVTFHVFFALSHLPLLFLNHSLLCSSSSRRGCPHQLLLLSSHLLYNNITDVLREEDPGCVPFCPAKGVSSVRRLDYVRTHPRSAI